MRSPPPLPFALSVRIAEYVGICGVLLCFFSFVSWMVIMSGCSSVTRSFNSSCLFVMLLIFSCRSVKSFWLGCDVVACECVVELSVVVWVVRAEGGSLRFWGPGLLSTSPALSMSSASHSAGSSGWLAQKNGSWAHFPVGRESRCNLSIQIESSKATTCRLHPSLASLFVVIQFIIRSIFLYVLMSGDNTTRPAIVDGQVYGKSWHIFFSVTGTLPIAESILNWINCSILPSIYFVSFCFKRLSRFDHRRLYLWNLAFRFV